MVIHIGSLYNEFIRCSFYQDCFFAKYEAKSIIPRQCIEIGCDLLIH